MLSPHRYRRPQRCGNLRLPLTRISYCLCGATTVAEAYTTEHAESFPLPRCTTLSPRSLVSLFFFFFSPSVNFALNRSRTCGVHLTLVQTKEDALTREGTALLQRRLALCCPGERSMARAIRVACARRSARGRSVSRGGGVRRATSPQCGGCAADVTASVNASVAASPGGGAPALP